MNIHGTTTARTIGLLVALALAVWLPGAGTTPASAQETGDGSAEAPRTSTAGDVFFGPRQVAEARANVHGRALVEAAVRRNREAAGNDRDRKARRPDGAEDRPVVRRPLLHPTVPRMVVMHRPDHRGVERAREEPPVRRARRRPDVSAGELRARARATPGAPTAMAGRIGRHLRGDDARPTDPDAPAVRCASVQLRTRSGIGFRVRVDAAALGARGPADLAGILRRRMENGDEPLVLPVIDGRSMHLPPDGIEGLVVGPCR